MEEPIRTKAFVGVSVVNTHSSLPSVTTAPCFKGIVAWCCDTRKKLIWNYISGGSSYSWQRMGASSTNTPSDASISNSSKEKSQAKQAAGGCQPHGNLTPAHADGCAARCFEGVQCGSIFKGADGHGQQSAALFLDSAGFAPSRAEDHGGRCPLAHTGTNVPVCSIPAAIAALFNVQHRLLISLHQPSSL